MQLLGIYKMWHKFCTRQELLELIEQDGTSQLSAEEFVGFSQLESRPLRLNAYWKDDPRKSSSIPTGVIVTADESRDFLAWAATYSPLRPFTAYCRIVESHTLPYLADMRSAHLSQLEN